MHVDSILKEKGGVVHTIAPDVTVFEALRAMAAKRIGALVVSRDGRTLLGIVSERAILQAIADHGAAAIQRAVSDIMTVDVPTCSPGDQVAAIMAAMTHRRARHIPVIDQHGLCGIVSIGDVVKYRLDEIQREAEAMREYISRTR